MCIDAGNLQADFLLLPTPKAAAWPAQSGFVPGCCTSMDEDAGSKPEVCKPRATPPQACQTEMPTVFVSGHPRRQTPVGLRRSGRQEGKELGRSCRSSYLNCLDSKRQSKYPTWFAKLPKGLHEKPAAGRHQ